MSTQWHPLFADLLRPLLEPHYEIQTNVPVGDAPREADFVLLRRTQAGFLPFQGLWRYLIPWNILEFKGPTVRPRLDHLERLIEVGLGIHRHLMEQELYRPPKTVSEVSFWYLSFHLGLRFLRHCWAVWYSW